MATSQAINAKSFCNYIVSLCTYFDGTALSSTHKTQLYDYLIEGCAPSQLITIQTALAIINRIYRQATNNCGGEGVPSDDYGNATVTVTGGSLSSALSYNTAKSLVTRTLPASIRSHFCTLGQIYTTSSNAVLNNYNYQDFGFYVCAPSSYASHQLVGSIKGGGGGGSGGVAGDNGKQNVTTRGGAGYKGSDTVLYYWSSRSNFGAYTVLTAAGGAGAGQNSYYHEGNAPYNRNGSNGSDGSSTAVNITLNYNSFFEIFPGRGGSGGGGGASKVDWSGTVAAQDATSTNGGNGAASNSWSGEDWCYGSGGGAASGCTPGTGAASGPSGSRQNGTYSSNGVGGRGGNTDLTQTSQPNTIGTGGKGGLSSYQDDVVVNACGGNGGNSGTFILDSTCSAASLLLIWVQNDL